MTFRSKISRTKKKSSDERWTVAALAVAFFSLFIILAFGFRAVTVEATYGVIPAEIPVVPSGVEDPAFHRFEETPVAMLSKFTPAVVLTAEAFYFGDLEAFTTNFADARDKYVVRHVDGEPQLYSLLETMQKWIEYRAKNSNVPKQKAMVLVPSGDIPVPIVVQVIAGLRKSPYFERVVLGSGLM
jgi:hypothetical protein